MTRRKPQTLTRGNPSPTNSVACGRPEVIVEFLFDRGMFHVSVRNIGERPALGVSVRFSKKIIGLGGTKDISALALFKKIEFLGPKREIVTFVDASSSYFKRRQPTKLTARVSYCDSADQRYDCTISHDLEIYRELPYLRTASPDE